MKKINYSLLILLIFSSPLFGQETWNTNFVGHFGVYKHTRGIAIDGSYAYVCESDQFVIRDISDPNHFFEKGSLYFDRAREVMIHDGNAFVSSLANEFQAIDISNPLLPVSIGKIIITNGGLISNFTIAENYAYLACLDGGLAIFNISDPKNMTEISNYDSVQASFGVDVSGQYAYLADMKSIHIMDINDPSFPTRLSTYELYLPDNARINNIKINGNYAYLITEYYGLFVLDIGDPENILEVGTYLHGNYLSNIYFQNDLAYLSASDSGFLVLDISDPADIITIGITDADGGVAAIHNNYAYLSGKGYTVIDIQYPETPEVFSKYYTPGNFWDVDIKENYAFVSAEDSGMRVLDISDKSKPIEVGKFLTPFKIHNLDVQENFAYLPDRDSGLYIIDISNPENPFEVGHFNTEYAYDIAVKGNLGYLICPWSSSLIVLDFIRSRKPI